MARRHVPEQQRRRTEYLEPKTIDFESYDEQSSATLDQSTYRSVQGHEKERRRGRGRGRGSTATVKGRNILIMQRRQQAEWEEQQTPKDDG